MQSLQVQQTGQLALANGFGGDRVTSFGHLRRFLASALRMGKRSGASQDAVPHYEGHAWCIPLPLAQGTAC
jgi:hypothetical protein